MARQEGTYSLKLNEARGVVFGEGNTVIQQFVTGIDQLPTRYDRRIANFLTEYLGRPGMPIPFGGRDADLERLDNWLADDSAAPYLLLCGTGGRGKSTLLVHWSRRLLARKDIGVVFVPVSVRYRTNLPAVFFPALAARLAELYGEAPLPGADRSPEVWEGVVADYLARTPRQQRVVVVLDGLDEAADWELGPHLLPADPPAGLRVVVSARTTAERSTGEDWLAALGWQRGGLGAMHRLDGISREGIRDVLAGLPPHPEEPVDLDVLVGQLHRLTLGDPLLLGEHLRDLLDEKGHLRRPAESFGELPAGLDGVFQRWWQDQRELWRIRYGALGTHGVEAQVNALMAVFARALGPLRKGDLAQLDPELVGTTAETALAALGRFLVGEGADGLVLSHARLAEYWAAHRMTESELRRVDARFASWGLDVARALNDGTLTAPAAPPYTVQYLAAHLHRTGASADDWRTLLSQGWQQAWVALEGTYSGFLSDVHACRHALRRADADATVAGGDFVHVADDILCALIDSSVGDETRAISPELLGALVRHGMWTPVQALVYARGMPGSARAAALLVVAAEQDGPERRSTAVEALKAAAAEGFDSLAATAPRAAALGAVEEAAEHAMGAAYFELHALVGGRVAAFLPADRRPPFEELAQEVLRKVAVASTYADDGEAPWRAMALAGLAPLLDERNRRAARLVLGMLLPHLTPDAMAEVAEAVVDSFLPELLALARASGDGAVLVNLAAAVTPRLPAALRTEVVAEAVAVALDGDRRSGGWLLWGPLAGELSELAAVIPAELHVRVLEIALSARDDIARGDCLAAVLPHLAGEAHAAGVAAARTLGPALPRACALAAAIPQASEDHATGLAREALNIANDVGDRDIWAGLAQFVAPVLPDDDLATVAQEALRETEGLPAIVALCGIGLELAARGRPGEALRTTCAMADGHDRLAVFLLLSTSVDSEHREELVRELARTADELGDAGFVLTLERHVGPLDEQAALALLGRALAVAHPRLRAVGLRVLLEPLSGPLTDEVRDAALRCAAEASGSVRLYAVVARLGHAEEVFAACDAMELPRSWYETAVAGLAPYLSRDQVTAAFARVAGRAEEAAQEWDRERTGHPERTWRMGEERPVPGVRVLRALARCAAKAGDVLLASRIEDDSEGIWDPGDWLEWIRDVVVFLPEADQRRWLRRVPGLMARLGEADALLEQTLRALPGTLLQEIFAPPGSAGPVAADMFDLVAMAVLAPLLPEPSRSEVLEEVWQRVRAQSDTAVRLRALRTVAPHLPPERRLEACAELLDHMTDDDTGPASLRGITLRIASLAPYLTQGQVRRLLADEWGAALDGPDLVALLVQLSVLAGPHEAVARAASLKREGVLQQEDEQALLVRIADSRTGDDWHTYLEQALTGARAIGDDVAVLRLMARLSELTAAGEREPLVERCLRACRGLMADDVPDELPWMLEALLPLLDHAGQRRLFDDVSAAYRDVVFASPVAGRIIALMASTGHGEVALRTARAAPPGYYWDEATVAALAALPEELVDQAVELAYHLARSDAEGLPGPLLCGLAARYSGERREDLVRQVLDIAESSAAFPRNLAGLLPMLPSLSPDALRRAQALAEREDDPDPGLVPAVLLARSMTETQLLETLDEIGSFSSFSGKLPALERVLPELCRRGCGDRAMEAFAELVEPEVHIHGVVRALAPVAPVDGIPVLIAAVRDPRRRANHSWLLARLALRAPQAALKGLEDELPALDGDDRVLLLASLSRRAQGRAGELARRAVDEAGEVLDGAWSTREIREVTDALATVADLLPPRVLADALLMSANQLPSRGADNSDVQQALDRLTAPVGGMPRADQFEVVRHFLDGMSGVSRRGVLTVLRGLAPVVTSFGGEAEARRLFDTVADIQRRWPSA